MQPRQAWLSFHLLDVSPGMREGLHCAAIAVLPPSPPRHTHTHLITPPDTYNAGTNGQPDQQAICCKLTPYPSYHILQQEIMKEDCLELELLDGSDVGRG
jgi:hypothetical protein